ncbi:MAG: sulfite exporter TauE/SafE family protein [Hahellaceae bacterium]|nr:sulfite exporter TauE/SafE family protein [Hahellaceae bacterium]MCP5169878.1 sulfite exporter TauE/SafE family protein [Hahellaceae bacterium]
MEIGLYLGLGAFAGILAGLFGVGGGLIIVPALVFGFTKQGFSVDVLTHMAVGTSLATIIFTSLSSVRTHHSKQAVQWNIVWPMSIGIVLGAFLGGHTAALISGPLLQTIIGCFALLVALQMGLGLKPKAARNVPGHTGLAAAGGVVGWASAIFGIGGGSLTVPFLSWCNVKMQQAVGTSSACGLPIALAGAASYMVAGWSHDSLPDWSVGFVYIPALLGIILTSVIFARLGARLAHRLPPEKLKKLFALLLLVVGLQFILK